MTQARQINVQDIDGFNFAAGRGSLALVSGGGSYAAGDTITVQVSGVTFSTSPVIVVNSVSGGVITGCQLTTVGVATSISGGLSGLTATQASTSGAGSGASFTLSFGPIAADVSAASLGTGGSTNNGNFFIGAETPNTAMAGGENTFVGDRAGGNVTTGSFCTAVGHNALGIGASVNVTGSNNTAVGNDAMRNITATAATNVAVGVSALRVVAGSNNVAVGNSALTALAAGSGNVAVGLNALSTATTCNDSTAIGQNAGLKMTASQNVIVGSKAASDATGGAASNLVVIGYQAGKTLQGGGSNVIIGPSVASTTLVSGTNNVLIGTTSSIDTAAAGTSNTIQIGAGSTAIFSATGCGTPSTSLSSVAGNLGIGKAGISSAVLALIAGTTSLAQINMPSSTAPTSPNDGDFWYDGTNLKFRHGGTTQTITWT